MTKPDEAVYICFIKIFTRSAPVPLYIYLLMIVFDCLECSPLPHHIVRIHCPPCRCLGVISLGYQRSQVGLPNAQKRRVTKAVVVFKFSRDWLTSKCKSAIEWSRYSSARPVVPGAWRADLIKVLHKCQLYLEGTRTRSDKCEVQSIWKGSEAPLKGGRDKSFYRRNASSVFSGQGSCGSSSTHTQHQAEDRRTNFASLSVANVM